MSAVSKSLLICCLLAVAPVPETLASEAVTGEVTPSLKGLGVPTVDLRTNNTRKFSGPHHISGLQMGEVFDGQYFNRGVTGTVANAPISLAHFTFLQEVGTNGLVSLHEDRGTRTTYNSRGEIISTGPFFERIIGEQPLSIVFPTMQFAFGMRVERLDERPITNDNAPIIEFKIFDDVGQLIEELRYTLHASSSFAFIRCDFLVDIAGVQVVSPSKVEIGISEVAFFGSDAEGERARDEFVKLPEDHPYGLRECPRVLGSRALYPRTNAI